MIVRAQESLITMPDERLLGGDGFPAMLSRVAARKETTSVPEVAPSLWDGNGKWIFIGIAALLIAGIVYFIIKK